MTRNVSFPKGNRTSYLRLSSLTIPACVFFLQVLSWASEKGNHAPQDIVQITGRVLNYTGCSIPNANVDIRVWGNDHRVRTDTEGRFQFGASRSISPADSVADISIHRDGYEPYVDRRAIPQSGNLGALRLTQTVCPDRLRFVFDMAGPAQVNLISSGDSRPIPLTSNGSKSRAKWGTDCSKILFESRASRENPEIVLMDFDNGRPLRLTSSQEQGGSFQPSPSPDGRRVAFVRNDGIYVLSIATMEENLLLARVRCGNARHLKNPSWSPSGHEIVFVANYSEGDKLWMYDLRDSSLIGVTRTFGRYSDPFFSPDGNKIFYTSGSGNKSRILCASRSGESCDPLLPLSSEIPFSTQAKGSLIRGCNGVCFISGGRIFTKDLTTGEIGSHTSSNLGVLSVSCSTY